MSSQRTSADLGSYAATLRAEAEALSDAADLGDTAAARLNATNLRGAHRHTDSRVQRYLKLMQRADTLEARAARLEVRESKAQRVELTRESFAGVRAVRDELEAWHRVIRVNAKTVTVGTAYSWTERLPFHRILETRS